MLYYSLYAHRGTALEPRKAEGMMILRRPDRAPGALGAQPRGPLLGIIADRLNASQLITQQQPPPRNRSLTLSTRITMQEVSSLGILSPSLL